MDFGHYRIIRVDSRDPCLNLALEEHLFLDVPPDEPRLLVWRNDPCVVIGRFQNPWLECDTAWCRTGDVPVIRRISGGGTVWHDPGNWNFSFMQPAEQFDQQANLALLVSLLASWGIAAETTARGDITVGGRKVSGNAMSKKHDRVLHHCSLLVKADLTRLRRSLKPPALPWTVESRGVASVPSPVANLFPECEDADIERLWAGVGGESRSPDSALLEAKAARYRDPEWNFGQTPAFRLLDPSDGSVAWEVADGRVVGGAAAGVSAWIGKRLDACGGLEGLSGTVFTGAADPV